MSGRLRTELGLAKKRLNDALDLELDPIESFTDASPDDIYDEIINIVDNAGTLRTEQERIHRLDKQWVELIERDETEKKTMEDYKKRLGDYMGVVAPVAQQLVLLEKRYKGLCDLHRAKSTSPEEYPVFDLSSTPVCTSTSDQPPNSINPSSTTISASAFDQPPNPVNPSSAPVHTSTSDQPPSYTNPPSTPGYASASNHRPSSANPSTTFTFTDKSAMATNRTTKLAMGQLLEFPTNRALGTPLDYSIGQAITHVPEPARLATADISGSKGSMAPLQFANVNSFQLTLPPIKLTTFNGNHLEYATFMDRFSSVIGNKPIEDVAKFQYLASALEGDAKSLIEFLPITSENYHIALSILKDNYGDTFRTRHYLLRQLQDLPSVAHSKNTKDINAFWTKATVALNQLRNIYPLCDNTTTADILIQKLPRFYISKIFISGQYQEFTASQLLQHVHRLIQADQLVSTVFNTNSNREERVTTMTTHTKSQQNHQTSKHQRQIPSKKGQSTPSTPCVFCASQESFHYHHDCPTYRTVNERHQRARNLQLCFKCLRHHDDFRSCTRVPKCRKCEGNHQTSFCKRNEPRNNTSPQSGNQQHLNQPRFNQGTPTPSTQPGQPFTPRQPQPSRSQQSNHPFNQRNGSNFRQNTQNTTNLATTEEYEPNHLESSFVATVSQHFSTITPASINFTNELDVQMFDSNAMESPKPVAMMATQLPIDNNDKTPVQSNILFDNGSDRSFISSELVKILKLPIDSKQSLRLQTFGNSNCKSIETNNFLVTFNLPAGKRSVMLTEIPFITTKLNCVQLSDSTVPELMVSEQLDLPRIQSRPDILIDLDSMYQILGNTTSEVLPNGMTMHQTDCGIIVTGRESTLEDQQYPDIDPYRNSINLTSSLHSHLPSGILQSSPEEEHKALQELLENFWTIDHVGSTDAATTKDEETALRFFLDTTTREADGRYTVRWPYKESSSDLPDNRFLAVFRLQSTLKRLEKDENLRMQYNNIIVDQLRRDFIEFVDDETISDGAVIHYLSHHPVIKTSSKTTKIRIVFDASAKINKSSQCLNDILYTGMSLLPQIPAVLLRVRCPVILQSGDIEKAFLQLGLDIRDRDACRFLWHFPDEDKPKCLRFKRVCFGVTSSPSLLTNTVKKHLRETNSHLSTDILKNIYVDNVFMGPPNVETGKMFYHESKRLFSSAMMNLTQFFSNSEELNNYIANEEKCSPEAAEQKILGVDWNTKHDQLGLKLPNPITSSQFTKRTILKTIASIYDPLGLLSPVTLLGKLFFQKLWLRTMDWDSPLTREEIIEWTSIENKWNGPGISFDRQYFQNPILPTDAFELHLFSDASEHAYGAVAYLRRLSGSTNEATIIFAKCRVSPVKKVFSIPQKELMGIEKAAQIGKFIIKEMELHFTNCYIWTDSLCSVDQLVSNNANTIFSRNRLKKIKQFLPSAIISHVPGRLNPADLISRGCSLEELRSNEIWWKGPQFLQSQDPLPIRESSLQQAICNLSITTPAPVEPLIPFLFCVPDPI